MAYLGEHMHHCEAVPFDWQYAHLIVVSGAGPNFCGHALKNWRWLILPSNCASFVEEILEAGGSKVSNLLNCPVTRWE